VSGDDSPLMREVVIVPPFIRAELDYHKDVILASMVPFEPV
jgi:hypothetical protein